jgi:hypothetical protein
MMSKDWEPIWRREQRTPIFLNSNETDSEEFARLGKEEFSSGKGKPLCVLLLSVIFLNYKLKIKKMGKCASSGCH